jgi:integrase
VCDRPQAPQAAAGHCSATGRRPLGRHRTGVHYPFRHADRAAQLHRSFDRRISEARVRRITVHGTRKSCGSLLAALDVHPRAAMQILRHSKIAITMEIYTEVVSSATREALRKLGDQLGP